MKKAVLKSGAAGAVAAAAAIGLAMPAAADVAPQPNDAVAVGSDTVQYVADFVADGVTNLTPPGGTAITAVGYNTGNTGRRLFSFDGSADANGRTAYQNGTSTVLASTIVERAGTPPVVRPNGSGSGITALLADTTQPYKIDFVRSSRLPKASEQQIATSGSASSFGGLHVFQIATDAMQVAVLHGSSHVPNNLTGNDLVNIYNGTYKKWSDVPGYTGSFGSEGILPIMPQTGSGTYGDFTADLKNYNGGTAITAGANVVYGEEHDPTAITGVQPHTDMNGNQVSSADALEPFSTGRYNLIQSGYLGASLVNSVDLNPASGWVLNRKLYMIARQSDFNSTAGWQAGSTVNKTKALFGTSTSWFAKGSNASLFTAAGVTQSWADLGNTISSG